jgi:hypothetical protein
MRLKPPGETGRRTQAPDADREADISRLFHADLRIKAAHSLLEAAGRVPANRVGADPAFIMAMAGFILYQV